MPPKAALLRRIPPGKDCGIKKPKKQGPKVPAFAFKASDFAKASTGQDGGRARFREWAMRSALGASPFGLRPHKTTPQVGFKGSFVGKPSAVRCQWSVVFICNGQQATNN